MKIEATIEYFFGNKIKEFKIILQRNTKFRNLNDFLFNSLASGVVLVFLVVFYAFQAGIEFFIVAIYAGVALILPLVINYFLVAYKDEKRKKEFESALADILLEASLFQAGHNFLEMLRDFAENDNKIISKEFGKAYNEISKGENVEKALEKIYLRNNSTTVRKSIKLLIKQYSSGSDISQELKDTADYMMESNVMAKERIASIIVEKYTILFGGGLIVPFILGILTALVKSLNIESLERFSIGLSAEARKALMESIMLGNQIYIVEYAIIAAVFVAFTEGNIKKAILYAVFLLPVGFGIYTLVKGGVS